MKVVKFQFSLFGINTYLVIDDSTKDCAVIDPGMMDDEEREALDNYIVRNDLRVTHIINTHLHLDHCVGDAWSKRKYGVPVYAHEGDLPFGNRVQQQARGFGIVAPLENAEITSFLKDGEVIKIGDGELKVIHVPGHSPGSVALYDAKGGYVIAGDALFSGSIGRTDLAGGNHQQLIDSIKGKLLTLPTDTVVYPGHGPATTIGREAIGNPFLV